MAWGLQFAAAIFAGLAALFWARSALMKLPDFLDMTLAGATSPVAYMRRQAKWSAIGAGCAAISATLQAISMFSTNPG